MDLGKTAERLRKVALGYPESYEESPWGDRVVKVRGKIFLFCGVHEGQLHLSVKLPESGKQVLKESFAKPTAYGLGKSGWVSASFPARTAIPEARIAQWIAESYRALAPKKLLAQLAEVPSPVATKPGPKQKLAAKKVVAPKPLKARVLIFSQDQLRVGRAREMLAARGITLDATDATATVRKRLPKLDAVILDVGRLQDEGLTLAAEIDSSDLPIHLFIAGIRDAAARKRAQTAATSAELFRAPPGDPEVADAIHATLARYAKRD